VIDRIGAVRDVRVISGEGLSEDATLRKAGEDALHYWRYAPKTFEGVPMPAKISVDITFPIRSVDDINSR
jgi:hypothetical protein